MWYRKLQKASPYINTSRMSLEENIFMMDNFNLILYFSLLVYRFICGDLSFKSDEKGVRHGIGS